MSMIPRGYINAIVAIGVRVEDRIAWTATGFLLTRKIDKEHVCLFLVTNRHVLDNKESIVIRMKEKDTETLRDLDYRIKAEDGTSLYKLHRNTDIDIAVLPIEPEFIRSNNLEYPAFDIDGNAMTSAELREHGADEGTLVYMLGFPMALVNETSNVPICRLGCIARVCEAHINETHNIFLDIQCFPGNSGGPIVTRPESTAIQGTPHLERSVLVGIVHSNFLYNDQLRSDQTGKVVEIRTENSGIACAHPVEYIREVIDDIIQKGGS